MKSVKARGHLLINLYCKTYGVSPNELEFWDGPNDNYTIRRKENGLIASIPRHFINLYLSDNKATRDQGRSRIIDAFQNFKQPIETDRVRDRYSYDRPDFVYVEFRIDKGPEEKRWRVLNVIDSSKSGIAMLISEKDSDLLEILEKGDKIRDMSFFGIGAGIKQDGTVMHMTKITKGEFKGCFVLGVEAQDL